MRNVIFVLTSDSCQMNAVLNLITRKKKMHFRTYPMIFLVKFQLISLIILIFTKCDKVTGIKGSIRSVDVEKTKVWGVGLEPDKIVLPVRHFYIQPLDAYGKSFNSSISNKFIVDIFGDSSTGKCRTRVEQLDARDGVYIVRYKTVGVCWNVEIHILYYASNAKKHVAKSPYRISGKVFSEKCRCPQPIDQWLSNFKCSPSYEQIRSDLKPFPRVNFTDLRPKLLKAYDRPASISICDYVIKNNNIYRKCYGQHTGFKMFVDALLSALVRLVKLPDTEFMVNLGDWPLVKKGGLSRTHGPYPMFSWCGSEDTFDIVMPTYDITESSLEAMSRVSIDILSVQNAKKSWEEKEPIAFWRGRDSRRERLKLVDLSRQHPDLFNVSLTNFFFFRDEEAKYGPKTPHISFFEFFDYKYQINIDGTVAAYRFPYLLAGNSVVFKQDSPFYEYFYSELIPMHHYIPVKRDLSNLVEQINWAKNDDSLAWKIAKQGQMFANEHLTADRVLCYHVTLLKEWSQRLTDVVQVQSDMEEFAVQSAECDCSDAILARDEL